MLETIKDYVCSAADAVKDFFEEEVSFPRKSLLSLVSLCVLMGTVCGFLFSPIKKGIYVNISNNGNGVDCENEKKRKGSKK